MNRKIVAIGSVLIATALVLAGCTTDSATPSGSSTPVSAKAQKALDVAFAGVGSQLKLDPVKVKEGVKLYVVSCGESVVGCSSVAASMKEAGEAIGWDTTVVDGKLNPDGFAAAIRQGIAAGANVIIPVGIGCGVAQAAFQEAVNAGITVVGGGGVDDCSPKLWASERLWLADYNGIQQWNEFGKFAYDYAYGKTDGNVKAVVLNFTGQVFGPWITDGFNNELKSLGGGKVLSTVDVNDPEVADGSFVQKVTTALLNQPDANTLIVPVDGWLANGLSQAIVQSGSKLIVIGRQGDTPVMDTIRKGNGGVTATIGFATQWGAWGSIDTAARILAGEKPAYIGESIQAVDADHNMPKSGPYLGSVDFKKIFKAAWGK